MSDVDFSTALATIIRDAVREEVATLKQPQAEKKDTKATLRGIRALAVYLGVSTATAQRLKNEGKVPFSQGCFPIICGEITFFDVFLFRFCQGYIHLHSDQSSSIFQFH